MLNRYTLPLISVLVVSASLASCQRKVEEVTTPAEEIVFTVVSSSQTKSSVAEASPVSIPVKADGGQELTLEVSSCPWSVEESSTPATKVVPLDGSYFSTSHNSFGVMTYSASSKYAAAASRTWLWTDEAVYNGGIWAPSPSRAWPFAGNYLVFFGWAPHDAVTPEDNNNNGFPTITYTVPTQVANQKDLLVSKVIRTDSPSMSGIRVPITFGHALTAVRFIGVRLTITSVTISGIYDMGSYNMDTDEWFGQSSLSRTYSLTSDVTEESSTLMLIPQTLPSGATLTAETSAGTFTISLAGQVWYPGEVVTYKIIDLLTSFSVSATQKVKFSKGNLQAVFAAPGTSFTWKFADNQWDHVGAKAANTSINGNGSVSAAGTVDLFGWSTSATKYGIHNSTVESDYSGDFVDWGSDPNLVSTLGSGWRTLSLAEWEYLLNTRGGDGYPRFCAATVNGVVGPVIFPDDYIHPSGVDAPTSLNTYNPASSTNAWSGEAWTKMESAGCVFLPVAGYRNGTSVINVGTYGFYWSCTVEAFNKASYWYFYNPEFDKPDNYSWYNGFSVRLVRNL